MFNPLYSRVYLNEKTASKMDDRIIYNHVVILPDGREILIDSYHPEQGGSGWLQYPFKQINFKTISELLNQ